MIWGISNGIRSATLNYSLSTAAAQAGWNEADTCGADLSDDSKSTYGKLHPLMIEGDRTTNEMIGRSTVRAIVSGGEISMLSARKNAKAVQGRLDKAHSRRRTRQFLAASLLS